MTTVKPATFALLVGCAAVIVWLILNWAPRHVTVSIPIPRPDPEVRLCDQAVDALLHSKELIEITRAEIIVRAIPCDIGRRL